MTATNKLKARLVEFGYTIQMAAELLGISYQSFSQKLNNKTEFKASEIEILSIALKITNKDEYFFCSQNSQNGYMC